MGPLFQLVFFGIIYVVLSLVIGVILASITWIILKAKKITKPGKVVKKAFSYPFKLIPYLVVAVILTIVICEYVRGVDAPFTDYWSIPMGSNYQLLSIDTTDNWHIHPSGGGESISSNIQSVSIGSEIAFGETDMETWYIFDLSSSRYKEYSDIAVFQSKISAVGAKSFEWMSPDKYYYKQRRFGDILMFLVILIYPVYSFIRLTLVVFSERNLTKSSTRTK